MAKASWHVSRNGRRILTTAEDFRRRNDLPYGEWKCWDGRTVLFNRFYEPLFQRQDGGPVTPADPSEWLDFRSQAFHYKDADGPAEITAKAEDALRRFMADGCVCCGRTDCALDDDRLCGGCDDEAP